MQKHSLSELLRLTGPGIMAASAAIGGSHLVSSTQAGALYGWALAFFILILNFLKYPFFRAGAAYTACAGEDLIAGYKRFGMWAVWVVWVLNIFSGIVSTAALLVFSGALLNYFMPVNLSMPVTCISVAVVTFVILAIGRYAALSRLSKWIVSLLSALTVAAVVVACFADPVAPKDFVPPSPWTMASLGFIVMLMGWMPSPLDVTALTSVWIVAQKKRQGVTKQSAIFDFNVGFITTTLLAVVFVALGALVLCGSPEKLAMNGAGFTKQLISLYSRTIGSWSEIFIAIIAFCCIWGSTLTVADGYARVVTVCQEHLFKQKENLHHASNVFWMAMEFILGLMLIFFFKNEMLAMLKFAMISAFMTTPILAIMNYKLMTSQHLNEADRYGPLLRIWSWAGLIFLWGFLALFVWWQFLR